MDCPACSNELTERTVDDIRVDACNGGCGGVWLENWELQEVDEQHESAGNALLELDRHAEAEANVHDNRKCPACDDVVMVQRFFSVKKKAEIDECPSCGGTWLDLGELNEIRSAFPTEEERQKAANEFFENEFGKEMQKMKQQSRQDLKENREFANMLRWICPTHWLPGDQKWGAF